MIRIRKAVLSAMASTMIVFSSNTYCSQAIYCGGNSATADDVVDSVGGAETSDGKSNNVTDGDSSAGDI